MAKKEKNGAVKWLLIIVAAALLVFICWKAGWILNGNKNEVSEQEMREAIQEAVQDVNDELKDHLQGDLQEAADELRDTFKE